jgi:formylmethanofuran dehydrogenase subunit B
VGSILIIEVATGLINPVWTINTLINNIITVTTLTAADINGNSYVIDTVSSSLTPVLTP